MCAQTEGRASTHSLPTTIHLPAFSRLPQRPRVSSVSGFLVFPLTLSFIFSLSLSLFGLLLPCSSSSLTILRQKAHRRHHSESLIFWDAKKLPYRASFSSTPDLRSWGSGKDHFQPQDLRSGVIKLHINLELSPSEFTISYSIKLCCLWIFWKIESDPTLAGKTWNIRRNIRT